MVQRIEHTTGSGADAAKPWVSEVSTTTAPPRNAKYAAASREVTRYPRIELHEARDREKRRQRMLYKSMGDQHGRGADDRIRHSALEAVTGARASLGGHWESLTTKNDG